MIISAHQPAYLPWLGYFAKIAVADLFVLHDRSKIGRGNMLNRNKIGGAGPPLLLSVPLSHEDLRAELPINEIRLVDDGWRRRHWKAIQLAYRRAPHFHQHADFLADYYSRTYDSLSLLCLPFIDYCVEQLKIDTPLHRITEIDLPEFDKQSIIPVLCAKFGADAFIAGPQAVSYLDADRVMEHGVRVEYFHYRHPEYPQSRPGFESHLSVLDLLMHCGPDSAQIVRGTP